PAGPPAVRGRRQVRHAPGGGAQRVRPERTGAERRSGGTGTGRRADRGGGKGGDGGEEGGGVRPEQAERGPLHGAGQRGPERLRREGAQQAAGEVEGAGVLAPAEPVLGRQQQGGGGLRPGGAAVGGGGGEAVRRLVVHPRAQQGVGPVQGERRAAAGGRGRLGRREELQGARGVPVPAGQAGEVLQYGAAQIAQRPLLGQAEGALQVVLGFGAAAGVEERPAAVAQQGRREVAAVVGKGGQGRAELLGRGGEPAPLGVVDPEAEQERGRGRGGA